MFSKIMSILHSLVSIFSVVAKFTKTNKDDIIIEKLEEIDLLVNNVTDSSKTELKNTIKLVHEKAKEIKQTVKK